MGSVYEPWPAEKTEWCNPVLKADFETLTTNIDGTPRSATWQPVPMKLLRKGSPGKGLPHKPQFADSPWFGSDALIFRKSAIEAMKPILEKHGELLPLECPDAELWVFNPKFVLDALDTKASVGSVSPAGRLYLIDKYVFHADVVAGIDMFKLTNERASTTFVSDRFVDLWNASKLKGLVFKKVWSSE